MDTKIDRGFVGVVVVVFVVVVFLVIIFIILVYNCKFEKVKGIHGAIGIERLSPREGILLPVLTGGVRGEHYVGNDAIGKGRIPRGQ